MRLRESLLVMRRGRSVIVAGIVMGVFVGWVSAPGSTRTGRTFEATHTLLVSDAGMSSELRRATVLATRGPVPGRVADRLGVDRQFVQSNVFGDFRSDGGVLLITGRSADRAQAEALANVTAAELVAELGGQGAPLKTLEPAVASPLGADDSRGPTSRWGRGLLLGGFGLLLGVAATFVLPRIDRRIRDRDVAEQALGVPVVAEVPTLSRPDRGQTLSLTQPSLFLESYRRLRTSVDRWMGPDGTGRGGGVIVVASPAGSEGTTTTVAHLAAALGEVGRSVVAISADMRHPQLHLFFDKAPEPGLTDLLRGAPDTRRLEDLNLATTTRGVRLVASGAPLRNPGPLIDHIGDHMPEARSLADFVLIDSPPLLTTSDGAGIARHADAVLLVVRAGRTSVGAAARSVELLERLGIAVLGTVLVGSDGLSGANPKGSRRSGAGA